MFKPPKKAPNQNIIVNAGANKTIGNKKIYLESFSFHCKEWWQFELGVNSVKN